MKRRSLLWKNKTERLLINHKSHKRFWCFIKVNKRKNKRTQQFLKIFDFYAFEDFNYSEIWLYHYLLYLVCLHIKNLRLYRITKKLRDRRNILWQVVDLILIYREKKDSLSLSFFKIWTVLREWINIPDNYEKRWSGTVAL